MRRIGAQVSTAGGLCKAIVNIREIGGNCMQISAGSPRVWARAVYDSETVTEFKRGVKRYDLKPVYVHALYLANFASEDVSLRARSREALVKDMKTAAGLGAVGVVLHVGSHQGRGWREVREMVVTELAEVLTSTSEEVSLILENVAGQRGKIGSWEEIGEIVGRLGSRRVRVCIDTAHALAAGDEVRTEAGVERMVADIVRHLGWERVELLHLSDTKADLGSGRDLHENLGKGKIGFGGLQMLVGHPKLAHLPIILEVPGFGKKKGPDRKNMVLAKRLVVI